MSNGLSERPPRVVFFGMQSSFSLPPFNAFINKGIDVVAVVMPASWNERNRQPAIWRVTPARVERSLLPVLNSSLHTNIIQRAESLHIPIWEVARLADPATLEVLRACHPDFICVACFSLYIPKVVLDLPRYGCLNVHPSLLPTNRGPDPLFWTFREGKHRTGVTVHMMDEGMDTGDIVAQTIIDVPDGIRYAQLEERCAEQGGNLLAQAVWDIYRGHATPFPQDETKSSYHPFPSAYDVIVNPTDLIARDVYNIACGLAKWGDPVALRIGDELIPLYDAVSYSQSIEGETGDERVVQRGEELWIRCKEGWVAVIQR